MVMVPTCVPFMHFFVCFSDYKKVLELDPSQTAARNASMVSGVSDL